MHHGPSNTFSEAFRGPAKGLSGLLVLATLLLPGLTRAETPPVAPPAEAQAPDSAAPVPVESSESEEQQIDLSGLAGASSSSASSAQPPDAGSVVDQLEAGSGVRVKTICTNCNSASLTVNGLGGDRVRVTFDGMPAGGGLASVYYLAQFPAEFVGYTGVVRGPGSVLTGPAAIGGSIDFHSEAREKRHAFLDLRIGDVGGRTLKLAGADRWGPVGALVFLQGAKQNHVDANGDTFNEIGDFERLVSHGLFDFHLTENQVLTVDASAYDEDQIDGPGAPFEAQDVYLDEDAFLNWAQYGLRWSLERPDGLQLSVKGRYARRGQQQWSPADPFDPLQYLTYYIGDEQAHVNVEAGLPVGRAGFITTGMGWRNNRLSVLQGRDDHVNPFYINDGIRQSELYAQYERSVGSKWDFTIGARVDRFNVYGRSVTLPFVPRPPMEVRETAAQTLRREGKSTDVLENTFFLPRGQFHYRPNGKVVLGFAIGRGAMGASPSFEETCCGAAYQRSIGLEPERSLSAQGTVELHPTPDMRLTGTLFWTRFRNYQEKVVYKTQVYIPYYTTVNIPEARVQGFDLVHDMRFKGDMFNVGWTYTYTDSDDGDGIELPADSFNPTAPRQVARSGNLRYTAAHAASAYVRFKHIRRGTSLSLDASYQGPLQHFRLAPHRDPHEAWEYLESDGYTNVNVSFEQRIGKKGWTAYAGVENVTDYVQSDLGQFHRSYDWGPIQGRLIYGGMKFEH